MTEALLLVFPILLGIERDNMVDFDAKYHGQSVSVMDSLCLSWTVFCVRHNFFLSVSNTFWGIFRAELGQNTCYFDHNLSMRFEFVRKRR